MKRLKQRWLGIPRKWRVCINALVIICLIFGLYVLLECPAFTHEEKFYRKEKAELVGPSCILASFDQESLGYDHVILAETAEAVLLFRSSINPWDPGKLTYREKTGPVTILTVPRIDYGLYTQKVIDLPVFVFHDYHNAVRAELDLEFGEGLSFYTDVNAFYGDQTFTTTYEKTWHLESDQPQDGFFRFDIHAEPEGERLTDDYSETWQPATSEGAALEVFSHMMEDGDSCLYAAIPAAVRFYGVSGDLIAEEQLTIRSLTGQRYAQEGGMAP